jgi:hypothetical protein
VRLDSTPSGADVRVDGKRRSQTPTLLSLSSGSHSLVIKKSDSLEHVQPLEVAANGTAVSIHLWRREPDIISIRPVLPGAILTDARFIATGVLGLTVNGRGGSSATQPGGPTETWQLDPETGSLVRLPFASSLQSSVHTAALAPDGKQVAYATGGSGTTNSVWPTTPTAVRPDSIAPALPSVRVSNVDGTNAHTAVELARAPGSSSSDTERVTDLVWTPDGERLVIVIRTNGTPARSSLVLVYLGPRREQADPRPRRTELAVLPAEVVPGSAMTDPTGRWLSFLAHAATTSNTNTGVSLCVVELRPGGAFRDVADLGPLQRLPAVASVAWVPQSANREIGIHCPRR